MLGFPVTPHPIGRKETSKRRGIIPIPAKLRPLLTALYEKRDSDFVISFEGKRVKDIKKAFKRGVIKAGLDPQISPHTLKASGVSELFRMGFTLDQVSEYTATNSKTLEKWYKKSSLSYLNDFIEMKPQLASYTKVG